MTDRSASESSVMPRLSFSRNSRELLGLVGGDAEHGEPSAASDSRESVKSHACLVQPEVRAAG